MYGTRFDRRQPFLEQTGVAYVRGCEVQGMLDEKGRVIEEGTLVSTPAYTHTHIQDILSSIRFSGVGQTGVVMRGSVET